MDRQVMMLYAVTNGYLDDIPVEKLAAFESEFYRFMEASYANIGKTVAETKELSAEIEETLKKAVQEFKQGFNK